MSSVKKAAVQFWGRRTFGRVALSPVLQLVVASTPNAQARGVMDWPYIDDSTGMLFVFKEPGNHGIWMKSVRFDLDVAWLDSGGYIVAMRRLLAFDPTIVRPVNNAKYVIELAAGAHMRFGLRLQDWVTRGL